MDNMHKILRLIAGMHPYSRWILKRGVELACVIQGAALWLAVRSGGLRPGTVYIWSCIDYFCGSALAVLGTAMLGCLLLEAVFRRR